MGIQPIRKVVAPEIPDKLYFRIGDVARICEVPAYVLRFWETEFPQLKPTKGGTGQRLYRRRDVEMALRIKSLLYDLRYTIPGARQVFKDEAKAREAAAAEAFPPAPAIAQPLTDGISTSPAHAHAPQPRMASMAAPTQAATNQAAKTQAAACAPASAPQSGTNLRRQLQFSALRDEMQALLRLLQAPRPGQPATVSEPQPLRPRLVLEPRPAAARAEAPRPESLRLVREPFRSLSRDTGRETPREGEREPSLAVNQGDLFPGG